MFEKPESILESGMNRPMDLASSSRVRRTPGATRRQIIRAEDVPRAPHPNPLPLGEGRVEGSHVKVQLSRVLLIACLLSLVGVSCGRRTADVELGRNVVHGSFCVQCHGDELKGTPTGPPLQNLTQHWTEESLATYLQDPTTAIEKSPRLRKLRDQYKTLMPTFEMDEETRRTIARYLLEAASE